jgi:hypothetical protein
LPIVLRRPASTAARVPLATLLEAPLSADQSEDAHAVNENHIKLFCLQGAAAYFREVVTPSEQTER